MNSTLQLKGIPICLATLERILVPFSLNSLILETLVCLNQFFQSLEFRLPSLESPRNIIQTWFIPNLDA